MGLGQGLTQGVVKQIELLERCAAQAVDQYGHLGLLVCEIQGGEQLVGHAGGQGVSIGPRFSPDAGLPVDAYTKLHLVLLQGEGGAALGRDGAGGEGKTDGSDPLGSPLGHGLHLG